MKNTLYQLCSVNNKQMDSYIITTKDGKLLVVDGGRREDAENLLATLQRITGASCPHVNAWILTHAHSDHIGCFNRVMEQHRERLTVGRIFYSFPSIQYCNREDAWGGHDAAREDFQKILPAFAHLTETVYGFDTYDIGAAHIEILYSPNAEIQNNFVNNSSVVLRITLGGKKILFLGDAGEEEGDRLLALYKDTALLKADYVQMAHHGQNGVKKEVYAAIAPTACLWGTPDWLWNNDVGKGFNTHVWKTVEVRGWMDELGVKTHYVMKDGTHEIAL